MLRNHNFPDKIKIVLNTNNMAFIALDDKSLETGKSWAGYRGGHEIIDYDNGKFRLKLSKAAESSYSQGKLSFWTLVVTALRPQMEDLLILVSIARA